MTFYSETGVWRWMVQNFGASEDNSCGLCRMLDRLLSGAPFGRSKTCVVEAQERLRSHLEDLSDADFEGDDRQDYLYPGPYFPGGIEMRKELCQHFLEACEDVK